MSSSLVLAFAILSSSFFGSWHCAGMCGPIATLMSTRKSLLSYHFGRLISYVGLGALAGSAGQFFLNSDFVALRWISAIFLAAVLLASGLNMLAPQFFSNFLMSHALSNKIMSLIRRLQAFHVGHSGFVVGLLTALLPCGWLYTYVTAAVATKSPVSGAFTLFLFWLGGLPALSAVPMMVRGAISSAGLKQKRIAGAVLILAGLYSLASFMFFH